MQDRMDTQRPCPVMPRSCSAGCDISEGDAEVLLRASLTLQPSMTHEQESRTIWALAQLELVDPSITAYSSGVDTAARKPSTQAAQQQVRRSQGAPFCTPVLLMHGLWPGKGRGLTRTVCSAGEEHLVRGSTAGGFRVL